MGADEKVELDPALDLFAGSVAGIAALTVGFPFDTVKVRLQNPEIASKYRSVFHAFTTIIREERIRGLFRGISSPLLTSAPLNGVVFASYRFFLRLQLEDTKVEPTLFQVTLAGVGCGLLASLVTSPTELIKIQQQSMIVPRAGIARAPTARDVALEIWRQRGIRGLFRGFVPTAIRETGFGAYFGVYEATLMCFSQPSTAAEKSPLTPGSESTLSDARKSYPVLIAGALAGVASWLVTFPFDVIKTRVQSVLIPASDDPFRNTWSTIIHSYRQEGFRVFFHGLKPTLIRAIPVNMVTFATFEAIVHALS